MSLNIMLRLATRTDAAEILSVMSRADDETMCVCDDLDYVTSTLVSRGFGVVACDDSSRIIASLLLRYPGHSVDNLGNDIGLTASELTRVVRIECAAVLPEYSGSGLHSKMIGYAEEITNASTYKYFIAMVSPSDTARCLSFERNGYKLEKTTYKYRSLLRRIYMKEVFP